MKNLSIPKRLKKIRNVKFSANDLINFEKEIELKFNKGEIPYPIHLSKGNEAQLIEIFKYISKKDWVFSSWRNHYHAFLHGIKIKNLKKQIFEGKSMYVSSNNPSFCSSSLAGGILPLALGVAIGIKRKKIKKKVWVFVGDMTSQMGVFHEVYNYSKNFNLPIEFVIEDNGKSVNTDTKKTWNLKKFKIPKDLIYYKYKLKFPPWGTGRWVEFK
jgi:TPP-dependent pyruvate/acetoin dehydrogenase alpha subunit